MLIYGIESAEQRAHAAFAVIADALFDFLFRALEIIRKALYAQKVLRAAVDELAVNGDVVIVDSYIPYGKPLVKRVIGKAGDTIDIDFTAGIVYRDGEALDEPYTAEPTYTYEGMDFPLTVPDNCLFLMGDNRNGSKDSRSTDIGCVDTRDILGTALWRILPFSKIGAVQ